MANLGIAIDHGEEHPLGIALLVDQVADDGCRAASELDRLFKGGIPSHMPIRVPPKGIVLRESTNFLALSDPHVRNVYRKIWHHYFMPLNAEKLFQSSSISKSNLHKRFKREIGRPVEREGAREK